MSAALTRRFWWRARGAALAVLLVGGLASILVVASPALATERDEVANQRDEASRKVDELSASLEGIDAELAQIYLDLQAANDRIPEAEQKVAEAQARRDTANREHEIALGQLHAAQAEQGRLTESINQAAAKQQQANEAIGQLARQMYQNGSDSAVVIALTKSGTQSIIQRAAAADAMARSQSQAIAAALDVRTMQRTQESRQAAITQRIAGLEKAAAAALQAATAAEAEAIEGLAALEQAKKDAQAQQTAWNARKDEAAKQLEQARQDFQTFSDKLAQIDAQAAASGGVTFSGSASGFSAPVREATWISSPFGMRTDPIIGGWVFHDGVDFASACGTPIYATAPGQVTLAGWDGAAGNFVLINHGYMAGANMSSAYYHMNSAPLVAIGQSVSANTLIGYVGTTGYSTGCHLHFTIRQNGVAVDPLGYL